MRNSPTYSVNIVCERCGKSTVKTGALQRFCKDCIVIVTKETKQRSHKKHYPNAYQPKPERPNKCAACNSPFSAYYDGKPYCNKHYLRLYTNGSLELRERKRNDYKILGDVVEMVTNKGVTFWFDIKHLDRVSSHSWCVSRTGYLVSNIEGKTTKIHRHILFQNDKRKITDHIDGNPFNNLESNLRICTTVDNSRNCKLSKNNTSGYTGVCKYSVKGKDKFRANIMVNRKSIVIGRFDTFEKAVEERKNAEIKYFGKYAPSLGALKCPVC